MEIFGQWTNKEKTTSINSFNVEKDERDSIKLALFDIYKKASKQDRKLVDVLINLLNILPTENLLEHKVELINGYLQPILSPLFHKPEKSQLFLWLNTKTDLKNYDKGPDGGCVLIEKRRISQYTGFVEVKADYQKNNAHQTQGDLLRLALFASNGYDEYNTECILVLQAIGLNITAYGFTQHASGASDMFELMKVQCSASLHDLPPFCMQLNKLRMLQQFYDNYCSKLQATIAKGNLPHMSIWI
ncbi:hypothetical protein G6F62_011665 [Rhizopus arrhizus]|nr:hypothetical protein G6F23_009458 [Rhizopus arrhizus]KAG0763418.1 hypothetical protein G6F24_006036 [Rhizopus arrhizus]KAG0787656.1 hypothetical protein G6F21_007759 [Rhizopus arrhizus]KAG0809842.1 hypothetical protein G6F20_008447 [Rhizopus arrhizus]KAG0824461.1 hypothetical protein G6F18_010871 [Rhizopus arrhizus]